MSKIKELSRYTGTAWEPGIALGADAENIDVKLNPNSGSSINNLQAILTDEDNPLSSSTSMQAQINSKLSQTGDSSATIVNNLSNYDLDTSETSTVLIKDGEGGETDAKAAEVTAADTESQVTLWSKFNRFRKRVENKFGDYFAIANIQTAYQTTGTNDDVYSTSLLNSYFANVIGYTGTSTPAADTVANQLTSLNSNKIDTSAIRNNGQTEDAGYVLDARMGKFFYDRSTTGIIGPLDGMQNITIASKATERVVVTDIGRSIFFFISNSTNAKGILIVYHTSNGVTYKEIGDLTSVTITTTTNTISFNNTLNTSLYALWMHW